MVDDKQVIIGNEGSTISMMYGTGVKGSPETSESTTDTFSGAVVQGTRKVSYTLEIDKLRYEGMAQHMQLSNKIESMMENQEDITIIDTIYPKGNKPYQVIDHYYGCIVNGNDFEIKPTENTAENLKFKASTRKREWKELPENWAEIKDGENAGNNG